MGNADEVACLPTGRRGVAAGGKPVNALSVSGDDRHEPTALGECCSQ